MIDRAKKADPTAPRDYPAGYRADPQRPDVFDPALKHCRHAFVKGPPSTPEDARVIDAARALLLDRSLDALALSSIRDDVVLRGGLTLAVWYPGRARRPHDIDLVVRDATIDPGSTKAEALLAEIGRAVCNALVADDAQVGEAITVDGIWTYERAEGRRITVPWTRGGSIRDVIQIDVVFREPLLDTPLLEPLRGAGSAGGYRDTAAGPCLWFASRAESLAWKLLWLETDMYPQPKDLYDAVLLAEDVRVSLDFVRRVFEAKGEHWARGRTTVVNMSWSVDWPSFTAEYPELAAGDGNAWLARLRRALDASFVGP
jgi:hypothetical protein